MALESIRISYRGVAVSTSRSRFAKRFETDVDRVELSVPSTLHCPHQKRFRGNLTDTLVHSIATLL
jgi:hypothetical protein